MYKRGKGFDQNIEEAIKWYSRAVEQGYIPARSSLAVIYLRGDGGIEKNPEKAFQLVKEAAEKGYTNAQDILASMYEKGGGLRRILNKLFIGMKGRRCRDILWPKFL